MNETLRRIVLDCTGAQRIVSVTEVQSLWSGYGNILRVKLDGDSHQSVIVKHVAPPDDAETMVHPRGWTTRASDQRKTRSYQVEANWYSRWTDRVALPRVPQSLLIEQRGRQSFFVLEDLDAVGFSKRVTVPTDRDIREGLTWLATIHATLMSHRPDGLWQRGSYWHLQTRQDELMAIPSDHPLRVHADDLDRALGQCQFQTIIHGDAKLANFCFADDVQGLAAVDFQYVGGGCGMSDVSYFLGSCLQDDEMSHMEDAMLDHYFEHLFDALPHWDVSKKRMLRDEWTSLFPVAWADFNRFLLGWCPGHQKLTPYADTMTERAIGTLK